MLMSLKINDVNMVILKNMGHFDEELPEKTAVIYQYLPFKGVI